MNLAQRPESSEPDGCLPALRRRRCRANRTAALQLGRTWITRAPDGSRSKTGQARP